MVSGPRVTATRLATSQRTHASPSPAEPRPDEMLANRVEVRSWAADDEDVSRPEPPVRPDS
jgi:hypothetical protein